MRQIHLWHSILLLLLAGGMQTFSWWLSSDTRMAARLSGKEWHYNHVVQSSSTTAQLMLNTMLTTYHEDGVMRLLPKGAIQIDSQLNLGEKKTSPQIRIRIQASWAVNSGFLLFKAENYSALPLDKAGMALLEHHKAALRELVLAQFNNTRAFTLLDDQTLLIFGDNQRVWGLKGISIQM